MASYLHKTISKLIKTPYKFSTKRGLFPTRKPSVYDYVKSQTSTMHFFKFFRKLYTLIGVSFNYDIIIQIMGVQSFHEFFTSKHTLKISELVERLKKVSLPLTIAVDTSVLLYRALSRESRYVAVFGSADRVAASLLMDVLPFVEAGFKLCLVIDGKTPPTKLASVKREQKRITAMTKAIEIANVLTNAAISLSSAEVDTLTKKAWNLKKRAMKPTREMISRLKVQAQILNKEFKDPSAVTFIQAPYEADSLLAYMVKTKKASLVYSDDSDLFVLGMESIIGRHTKNTVTISLCRNSIALGLSATPQLSSFSKLTSALDRSKFAAILGTDYFPGGFYNIGPKTLNKVLVGSNFLMQGMDTYLQGKGLKNPLFDISVASHMFQPASVDDNGLPIFLNEPPVDLPHECAFLMDVSHVTSTDSDNENFTISNGHVPVPEVASPSGCVPVPEVASPSGQVPVPEVASPSSRVPVLEVASPSGRVPVPEVASPSGRVPVPEVASPSGRVPVPEVVSSSSHVVEFHMPLLHILEPQMPIFENIKHATVEMLIEFLQPFNIIGLHNMRHTNLVAMAERVVKHPREFFFGDVSGGDVEVDACRQQYYWSRIMNPPKETVFFSHKTVLTKLMPNHIRDYLMPIFVQIIAPNDPEFNRQNKHGVLHSQFVVECLNELRPGGLGLDRIFKYGERALAGYCVAELENIQLGFMEVENKKIIYLTGSCHASMRNENHQPQLWLSKDGIEHTRCTCIIGKIGCHHVVCLLLRLEHACLVPSEMSLLNIILQRLMMITEPSKSDEQLVSQVLLLTRSKIAAMDLLLSSTQKPRSAETITDPGKQIPASLLQFKSPQRAIKEQRQTATNRKRFDLASYNPFPVEFDESYIDYDGLLEQLIKIPGMNVESTMFGSLVNLRSSNGKAAIKRKLGYVPKSHPSQVSTLNS